MLIDKKYDSVWTVSKTSDKFHPHKQLKLDKKGNLKYFFNEGNKMLPRQYLEPIYHVNGIAYALTRQCIIEQKSRLGRKNGAFITTEEYINIDEMSDIEKLKSLSW